MLRNKKQIQKTVWAEFKDGFEVELRYAPRALWVDIAQRSTTRAWDAKAMTETESRDNAKWRANTVEAVVVGWRGLSAAVVKSLVVVDDYDVEYPYAPEECVWLMEQSMEFENWLVTVASQAALYQEQKRAEEIKNS